MNNEFWKQMIGSIIRHIIVLAGGALVTKGIITAEQLDSWTSSAVILPVAGAVLVLGGVAWSYLKVKFNINFVKAAIKAPAGTPITEVKRDALSKESTQVSA